MGKSVLQTLGPVSVKASSCFVPLLSQHASLADAGLLRITLTAYASSEVSAAMFSSHSLWTSKAIRAKFGNAVPTRSASQFTSLAVVPFARFTGSSFANVRMRGGLSLFWSVYFWLSMLDSLG